MRGRSIVVAALMAGLWSVSMVAGWAVSNPHPEPPRRLTIQGTLFGKLGKGGKVRFHIVATDPSGWFDLSTVKLSLLLHDQPIQEITFSVEDSTLVTTGQQPIHFPGQESLPGSFLAVFQKLDRDNPGLVRQTFSVTLNIWTTVRETIPESTVARAIVTNDDGDVATARVKVSVAGGWLSWGTFALAAAVALFLGGFVGNTLTSRRYRQREPSIWQIVERHLKEQKARPPAITSVRGDGGTA